MKILGQLGIVFAFGLAGEGVARALPLGVPASVWALLLLLAALRSGLLRPERLDETANFLAVNMAIFFVPAAVGIVNSYHLLHPVLFRLVIVCVLATALTFLVTYYTVRFMRKLCGGGQ